MSKSEIKLDFTYYNPVKIRFGYGWYLNYLSSIVNGKFKRAALFFGQSSMKRSGVIKSIKQSLSQCQIDEYGDISPNPQVKDVESFIKNKRKAFDLVIGVGGGSVIDFAKSVAFLLPQNQSISSFLEGKVKETGRGIPFIAIPTTSGTGSEVTPWASLWEGKKKKHSLSDKKMFPKYAVVDPELTTTMPLRITSYTAFDALSHAFEALWSKHSNPVSDIFAFESMSIFVEKFEKLISDLKNSDLRTSMSKASLYAGLAFSNTKTAAVHSVSYPITMHFGIPHGTACSLLLGEFLEYNQDYIEKSKLETMFKIADVKSAAELKEKLSFFAQKGGLPVTLKEAGIPKQGIELIVKDGFSPDRIANNPREVTKKDLRQILLKLYN